MDCSCPTGCLSSSSSQSSSFACVGKTVKFFLADSSHNNSLWVLVFLSFNGVSCRVVWRWGVRLGWGQSPVRSVVLLKKEKLKNGKKGKWMKRKRTTHSVMWENYKMDFLVFFANFSLINMYETGDSDSLWFSRFAFMKIFCYFNIFHSFYNIDRVNWNFQLDINFSFLFLNHYDIFFIYKIDDIYFELGKLIVSILTSRSQQVSYNILSSV